MVQYFGILALIVVLEVCYFKVADWFNIIDKPNERSSHKSIVEDLDPFHSTILALRNICYSSLKWTKYAKRG